MLVWASNSDNSVLRCWSIGWGWAAHLSRSEGHAGVDAGLEHLAVGGVVHLHHHLRLPGVGVVEPLIAGATNRPLAACLGNQVLPLLGRPSAEELTYPFLNLGYLTCVLRQRTVQLDETIVLPRLNPRCLDELAEVLVAKSAEPQPPAVLALEEASPYGGKGQRLGPGIVYTQAVVPDGRKHGIEQRHLNVLSLPVPLPRIQRQHDTASSLESSVSRRNRYRGVHRTVRRIGRPEAGSRRSHHPLPSRHPSPRVVRREPRHRAVHQSRVGLCHLPRPQAETLHHPRPEVLNHHIRPLHQSARHLPVTLALQIKRNTPLPPVPSSIGRRIPQRPARRVHPHHIRPLVR